MNAKERAAKRAEAQSIEIAVHVGKEGVTEAIVEELRRQLRQRKLVKVRLLPSARSERSAQEQAAALATATGSDLVDVRGGTAVFYRP